MKLCTTRCTYIILMYTWFMTIKHFQFAIATLLIFLRWSILYMLERSSQYLMEKLVTRIVYRSMIPLFCFLSFFFVFLFLNDILSSINGFDNMHKSLKFITIFFICTLKTINVLVWEEPILFFSINFISIIVLNINIRR